MSRRLQNELSRTVAAAYTQCHCTEHSQTLQTGCIQPWRSRFGFGRAWVIKRSDRTRATVFAPAPIWKPSDDSSSAPRAVLASSLQIGRDCSERPLNEPFSQHCKKQTDSAQYD